MSGATVRDKATSFRSDPFFVAFVMGTYKRTRDTHAQTHTHASTYAHTHPHIHTHTHTSTHTTRAHLTRPVEKEGG